ncbi:MAG: uracil-DNA glycosylase [Anaerolineales bacterium]|nr:uracil-DNA glycosylase [Anaerolineales bacterium]
MTENHDLWQGLENAVISCRKCPRLVAWREEVALVKRRAYLDWDYWGKPVPGFGDREARVLVVGLAPGAHGSNRTGRMFTGDSSGDFLYPALFNASFANHPQAVDREDELLLADMFISAVCRCAPPGNKPKADEISNCLPYLESEINLLSRLKVIVVLGRIAFDQTLRVYRQRTEEKLRFDFKHLAVYQLGENLPWLIASYHPSRQNTQTGRLTEVMFAEVWDTVNKLLGG